MTSENKLLTNPTNEDVVYFSGDKNSGYLRLLNDASEMMGDKRKMTIQGIFDGLVKDVVIIVPPGAHHTSDCRCRDVDLYVMEMLFPEAYKIIYG